MLELIMMFFLSLNLHVNFAISTQNQEQETKNLENNSNSSETITKIDFDKLFEIENLEAPKLEEPSRLKVWIRKYGLAFIYRIFDFKAWLINRCKKLFVKKN